MRHRTTKIIVATTAIAGVLGVGVAVADTPTCPYGNTPKATKVVSGTCTGDQQQLRKRDGTGQRHAQSGAKRGQHRGAGQGNRGAGQGNRGADCPYRS